MSSFDFKTIEAKWQKRWEKQNLYQAKDFDKRLKLYVLVEFPYPSGEGLHIGHAFTMTGADVYARKKRMEGKNVLFPMGFDAFGLPAENYAIKTGIHPSVTTAKSIANFKKQMKEMAFSFDWEREVVTTDPEYYRWTQWIFIKLFERGLAYKEKMPINWCPACKIGLANEEVINGKCERCGAETTKKELSQWVVKITAYADRLIEGLAKTDFIEKVKAAQINWIDRKEWIDIQYPVEGTNEKIVVATTRPDTNFGATFVVVAPEHPLIDKILDPKSEIRKKIQIPDSKLKEIKDYVEKTKKKSELERQQEVGSAQKTGVFTGLYAINQLNNYRMPIYITDFVLMSVGTGAVVGVPGHDLRDFDFAKTFDLPIIRVVVGKDGKTGPITKREEVQEEEGVMINSQFLDGLEIDAATKKIMDYLEEKGWGKRTIRYHLRDWIFSRQHYWGEPIPMVYCQSCADKGVTWWDTEKGKGFINSKYEAQNTKQTNSNSNDQKSKQKSLDNLDFKNSDLFRISNFKFRDFLAGWFPVDEGELPVRLPEVEKYQPTDTGESPLANIKEFVNTVCPKCGGPAKRETDTMPNWAGSDWYFLRYLDNKNEKAIAEMKKMKYWLPVDVYIGGDEHNTLHLLYSRFIYQFLWDLGAVPKEYPEPYIRRLSHGVILGSDGQRMSKSRGNVVTPDEVCQKYGVDAVRTYLMFIGPFEATLIWNESTLKGVVRFLEKFQKLVKGENLKVKGKKLSSSQNVMSNDQQNDQKVKVLVNKLILKVTNDIDNFQFNTAIAAMMEFLNDVQKLKGAIGNEEMKKLTQLLAPFAPYLAEELWEKLGGKGSVHLSDWPKPDPKYLVEEEAEIVVQINGKTKGTVKLSVTASRLQPGVEKAARLDSKVAACLEGKQIVKVIFVSGKLINFVVK